MNNPVFRVVALVVVVLGGLFFGLRAFRNKTTEFDHKNDLERIRREYVERSAFARSVDVPEKYKDEVRTLYKWYFTEISEHYNKYPGYRGVEEKAKSGKKGAKEAESALAAQRDEFVRDFAEKVRTGRYDPVFTAGDKGLRFDVYEVKTAPGGGEPSLRLSFALYGAQRKWVVDSSGGSKVSKLIVNTLFRDFAFQAMDDKDKVKGEMRASGDPFKVDNPERVVDDLPPGIVLGYYDIPKIPGDVAKADLTFSIGTRSVISGEEVVGSFVWKMPTISSEWKLPLGVGWQNAQEQVREDSGGKH